MGGRVGQGLNSVQKLSQVKACFGPGSQIWAVPMDESNAWYKKLNWYTSSQMTLWKYKKQVRFHEPLKNIINSEGLPFSDETAKDYNSVLVYTPEIFPNQGVLGIESKSKTQDETQTHIQKWIQSLTHKSKDLGVQHVRIFWGEKNVNEILKAIQSLKDEMAFLEQIELVTCEPDPL